MELEALSCNNCGAPLEVPTSADFVTCVYCKSRLAIRRTETAHYTELLGQLEAYRDHLADRVEYLRLRDELEGLEAQWQRERRRYFTRRLNGSMQAPTRSYLISSFVVAVAACALTAWWFYATANAGSGASFFGWVGAVLSLIAVVNAVRVTNKVNDYNSARQEYQQQRNEILNGMRAVHPTAVPHPEPSPILDR
ncbi:MAG: hypothetical protein QOH93_193 [Chloroflexia bacterium]|nr:hypothetical protein [Chloroflexia bacterium]